MSTYNKIATIILAAGMSSRMKEGKTKCMKKIDEKETIIQRMIRQQIDIVKANNIFISTGFQSEKYVSLNSDNIKTVENKVYKKDKNINSCFLCLEQVFQSKNNFDYVLIVEGDVILSKQDAIIIKKAIEDNKNKHDIIFVEKYNQFNKKRIGCVDNDGRCFIRSNESLEDRMTGIFLLKIETAEKLFKKQKKTIRENGMNYYYFFPFLIDKFKNCKNNFHKVYLNKSFTVNNQKEFKWAKKSIQKTYK